MEYTVRCVVRVELKSSRPAQGGDARARLESHVHDLMGELEHRWVSDS